MMRDSNVAYNYTQLRAGVSNQKQTNYMLTHVLIYGIIHGRSVVFSTRRLMRKPKDKDKK